MKLCIVVVSLFSLLFTTQAASIGHDKVQPISQPGPVTEAEKAAVKYKPSLRIDSGCHPYAAIGTAGNTNAGLKGSGSSSGKCKGSGLGSQVYGRAVWYNDLWAIIPVQDKSMILSVSTSSYGEKYRYYKYLPLPDGALNGTSAMINYLADGGNGGYHTVDVTGRTGGKFQDLIMWEQLTAEARTTLTDTSFGEKAKVPFIDANLDANLKAAWPY